MTLQVDNYAIIEMCMVGIKKSLQILQAIRDTSFVNLSKEHRCKTCKSVVGPYDVNKCNISFFSF